MSWPSMWMWPRSGLRSPISVLRNTDFPVPDGPSMTEISPAGRVSVTSPQMSCRPKDLVSPSTLTSTPTWSSLDPPGHRFGGQGGRVSRGARPRAESTAPDAAAAHVQRFAPGQVTARSPARYRGVTHGDNSCDRRDEEGAATSRWLPLLRADARRVAPPSGVLLDRNGRTGGLEGLLGLVRGLLVGGFDDRLRRALDELLGLL